MAEQEKLRELDLSNKEDRKFLKRLIAEKNKNRSYELRLESYRNIKKGSKRYNFTVMSDGTFRYNDETDRIKLDNANLRDAISNSNHPLLSYHTPEAKDIEADMRKYKVSVTYENPKAKPEEKSEGKSKAKTSTNQGRESSSKPTTRDVRDKSSTGTKSNKPDNKSTVKSDNSSSKSSELSASFERPGWMSVMPLYSPQEYLNLVSDYLTTMHGSINQLQSSTGPRVNDSSKQGYPRVPGSTIASEYVEPIVPKTRDLVVRSKGNRGSRTSLETVNTESTVTNLDTPNVIDIGSAADMRKYGNDVKTTSWPGYYKLNDTYYKRDGNLLKRVYANEEEIRRFLDKQNSIASSEYQARPMTSMGAVIPIGTYDAVTPPQLTTLPYFSSNTGVYLYSKNGSTQLGHTKKEQKNNSKKDSSLLDFVWRVLNLPSAPSYKEGGILKALQGTQLRLQNTQTPTLDAIMNNPLLAESFLLVLSQQLGKEISMEDLVTASLNPELAPQLEAIAQQVMKQSAALGAKLQYISRLRGKCPEGQELVYFAKGGKVCSACMGKKLEDGGKPKYMKDFEEKQKAKKGCKLKK